MPFVNEFKHVICGTRYGWIDQMPFCIEWQPFIGEFCASSTYYCQARRPLLVADLTQDAVACQTDALPLEQVHFFSPLPPLQLWHHRSGHFTHACTSVRSAENLDSIRRCVLVRMLRMLLLLSANKDKALYKLMSEVTNDSRKAFDEDLRTVATTAIKNLHNVLCYVS